jgi:hypothetical protein
MKRIGLAPCFTTVWLCFPCVLVEDAPQLGIDGALAAVRHDDRVKRRSHLGRSRLGSADRRRRRHPDGRQVRFDVVLAERGPAPRPRRAPVFAVSLLGVEEAAHHPVHPIVEVEEAVPDIEERSRWMPVRARWRPAVLRERGPANHQREQPGRTPRIVTFRIRASGGRRGSSGARARRGRSSREAYPTEVSRSGSQRHRRASARRGVF